MENFPNYEARLGLRTKAPNTWSWATASRRPAFGVALATNEASRFLRWESRWLNLAKRETLTRTVISGPTGTCNVSGIANPSGDFREPRLDFRWFYRITERWSSPLPSQEVPSSEGRRGATAGAARLPERPL